MYVQMKNQLKSRSSVALLCILSSGSAMNIYFFPRKMENLTFYFLGIYLIHLLTSYFSMFFWCLQIPQKTKEIFSGFLP
jgi:hypothetical protein